MEKNLGSAIEKIKREEQNKEEKLKAKRELESVKAAVDRSLRDVLIQIKKCQQDRATLTKKTDELRAQVAIQKIRRDVLISQLTFSNKSFDDKKAESVRAKLDLQELRSKYCKAVYEVSDECGVWALLTKPLNKTLPRATIKKSPQLEANEQILLNERRLNDAKERRRRAIAERERLKSEPETGEEFIR